ncbi:MAG: DUF4142 domain-containing protein [Acidobacteria bacterium]|nr:DUF4142 domain-containing protein [Acidobacteriota bacterium]
MTKRLSLFVAAAAAGALVLGSARAAAQSQGTTGTSGTPDPAKRAGMGSSAMGGSSAKSADSKFVMDAAKGGMAEVEMGRMAADKASNADVKQFGQKMVDDHSKAIDELKQVATAKGMTLPSAVDPAHKAAMDKMAKLSGAAFDKAYVADMVKDHKKDVADFKKEASSGKDPDVKAFASKTLPTLQEHLKMIQDLNAKMAGRTARSTSGGSK